MKISGILPKEKIVRGYKKFDKTGNKLKESYSPVSRPSSMYFSFTVEEENGLKEHFKVTSALAAKLSSL